MYWKIYKYRCDENGTPYGEIVVSNCLTQELMESYKNPKFVEKIEEVKNCESKVIWTR